MSEDHESLNNTLLVKIREKRELIRERNIDAIQKGRVISEKDGFRIVDTGSKLFIAGIDNSPYGEVTVKPANKQDEGHYLLEGVAVDTSVPPAVTLELYKSGIKAAADKGAAYVTSIATPDVKRVLTSRYGWTVEAGDSKDGMPAKIRYEIPKESTQIE